MGARVESRVTFICHGRCYATVGTFVVNVPWRVGPNPGGDRLRHADRA